MPFKSSMVITQLKYPCRRNCHLQTETWGLRQPVLRRERRWVRSASFSGEFTLLWSHHSIRWSDETWLPEWSGKLGSERFAGAVDVAETSKLPGFMSRLLIMLISVRGAPPPVPKIPG